MTIFFNCFHIFTFSSFQLFQKCLIVVTLLRINFMKLFFHYHTKLLLVLASIFKEQVHHIYMFCITIMKEMTNLLIIFNDIMLLIQIIQLFKKISHHFIIKHERFSSVCNKHKHVIKLQNELRSENEKTKQICKKHFNHKIV